MINLNKIAAVVVLYNSDNEVIDSISSYIDQVQVVYAIDNSTELLNNNIVFFLSNTEKIQYIPLRENHGIAYALNRGCENAVQDGMEWILTMDQDTIVDSSFIERCVAFYMKTPYLPVGIIAPFVELFKQQSVVVEKRDPESVDAVITSGSFMCLQAYERVGKFDDKLFIDWVDWDICFRLRAYGYYIVRLYDAKIIHKLGDTSEIRIFKKHLMYITNHSYIRYYYKTRNALFLCRKYKNISAKSCYFLRKSILSDFIKVLLFEKDKLHKLKSFYIAYKDYLIGKMGKLYSSL
jgi:rhamnosyltransferase